MASPRGPARAPPCSAGRQKELLRALQDAQQREQAGDQRYQNLLKSSALVPASARSLRGVVRRFWCAFQIRALGRGIPQLSIVIEKHPERFATDVYGV